MSTADLKCKAMAEYHYFSHDNIHFNKPDDVNENLGVGQQQAKEVMARWMDSTGHKANILNEDANYMGAGMFLDERTNTIYWTLHFSINE